MSAIVDLSALAIDAISSPRVVEQLVEVLAPRVADLVVARLVAQRASSLEPLSAILGISKRAALARLTRDPELRACGLRVGRSLRFRRADVEAILSARQRERMGISGR